MIDFDAPIDEGGEPLRAHLRRWLVAPAHVPDDAHLRRAAALVLLGPGQLEPVARWLAWADARRAEGWTAAQVGARSARWAAAAGRGEHGPPTRAVYALLRDGDVGWLRPLRADLEAGLSAEATPTHRAVHLFTLLADAEVPPAALASRLVASPEVARALGLAALRAVFARLDPAEVEAIYLAMSHPDRWPASGALEETHVLADRLPWTPAVRARLERLVARAGDVGRVRWLRAHIEALMGAAGPRELALPDMEVRRIMGNLADVRAGLRLGPVAEAACERRVQVPGAAELLDVARWVGCGDARRQAIAEATVGALCAAFGAGAFRLEGMAVFRGTPIAVVAPKKGALRLALVPGGTLARGFSEREEARLRALAEAAAGTANHFEEYGHLLATLATMRPVAPVRVAPFLLGQAPGGEMAAAKAVKWLEKGPFRLPSEAEWEHAARGGQVGQLTPDGDAQPDEGVLRQARAAKVAGANAFGLWGFGLYPEVCADVYADGYAGAPVDGRPRTGAGPRVVRGGALQVSPWQQTGEWQLLLNAVRQDERAWEDGPLFVRPALGLEPV
ncbi:MAG: SUMF1/EgtB/PvdO family nonheme iron enzyme [Myxococcales bacterium]|nr:SUMF1/EgtB/PvdO family nonheme iron enzyme [Myxococcales bacterium]